MNKMVMSTYGDNKGTLQILVGGFFSGEGDIPNYVNFV